MDRRIEFRGTPDDARRLLYDLPGILSGRIPDRFDLVRNVQLRAAVALLRCIQQDFKTKSRGGTGRDGVSWPKLEPATIAQRRIAQDEWKKAGLKGTPTKHKYIRGLLTEAQNAAWVKKFKQTVAWARLDMEEGAAKAFAAKVAWSFVKREMGAKTRLELFGNRVVDILRDTDKLYRSLSPGYADTALMPAPEGQIMILAPGRIAVGSSEKPWHHKGIPGKLPARSLWPLNDEIPAAWWDVINRAVGEGITELAALLVQRMGDAA